MTEDWVTENYINCAVWASVEDDVLDYFFDKFNIKPTKPARRLMQFFVANLMRMSKSDKEALALSLDKTPGIGRRSISRLINQLEEDGLIEVRRGYVSKGGSKHLTKVKPKSKDMIYPLRAAKGIYTKDSRIFVTNNGDRKLIPFSELTCEGLDRNNTLERYSSFLEDIEICSGDKVIDSCFTRSIYRDNYKLHGRIYSDWQTISSDERKLITLNGSPVMELDYACMGVNIIYNMMGRVLNKDAYSFSDKVTRDEAKKIVNILINAKSKPSALAAIRSNFGTKFNARSILREAESYHSPIKSMFYSCVGLKTMNIDANIANRVISHSTDLQIPILSIHDGFVLPQSCKEELTRIMKESYFHYMNNDICINED